MPQIQLGEDITPYYNDPMQDHLTIEHIVGDTYANSTACGDKLIQLHKELQRLDFPYFFVNIITTNRNIENELKELKSLYSTEEEIIKFTIVDGEFNKKIYKGNTLCVLPWIHKYVNPQGLVMPCCHGDEKYPIGNIKEKNLEDISTANIRQQMLSGERPDACSKCWNMEDQNILSFRERTNSDWHNYDKKFKLKYLDIRLSNKCNLMCRMCSGKFSNKIAQEEERLYGFTKYKDETLTPDLLEKQLQYIEKNIDTLEHVYFAGGEPLINEEHYRILQLLIDHKKTNITLRYNTNLSLLKFKQYDIKELWNKFNKVIVGASIDLIGDQSNYVRYGIQYEKLEENYLQIKDLVNVDFNITSILHLMNIYNLPILQKRWIELGLSCKDISFNLLLDPAEQAITVLPEHYKNIALVQIHNHLNYINKIPNSDMLVNEWQQATTFMTSRSDTHLLREFFRLTDDKDRARNQKFEDYFPEYKDLRNYA
jgi:MoaA/NifB/PqqE/SkfB family radical SAM enzyme